MHDLIGSRYISADNSHFLTDRDRSDDKRMQIFISVIFLLNCNVYMCLSLCRNKYLMIQQTFSHKYWLSAITFINIGNRIGLIFTSMHHYCAYLYLSQGMASHPVWSVTVRPLIMMPSATILSLSWVTTSSGSVLVRARIQAKSAYRPNG